MHDHPFQIFIVRPSRSHGVTGTDALHGSSLRSLYYFKYLFFFLIIGKNAIYLPFARHVATPYYDIKKLDKM